MPFTGSVFVSTYLAVFVAVTVNTAVPFGFKSEIFIDAIVEFVMSSETRCPAVPVNVAVALSPAFEMLTVTADPPGVIENETGEVRIVTASGDGTVRTYVCSVCAGANELARLARTRLAQVDRGLTDAERLRYLRA